MESLTRYNQKKIIEYKFQFMILGKTPRQPIRPNVTQ